MGDARYDETLEISEYRLERLAFDRRLGRQRGDQVARPRTGQDRIAPGFAQVLLDPSSHPRETLAEFGIHAHDEPFCLPGKAALCPSRT